MPRRRRKTLETGIRPWNGGWQAYITLDGRRRYEQFLLSTTVPTMRAWREKQRRTFAETPDGVGSFAADVSTYTERTSSMPTAKERAAHLELWLKALGRDRPRASITDAEIDTILQDWLKTLAPATVRKRRTALQSFFKKMDGANGHNPVKGSSIPPTPPAEARGLDFLVVGQILAAMPTFHSAKPGTPKTLSLAKIRATVLAYTGLPPGLLKTIHPADLVLTGAGSVRVRPRRKGKMVAARTLPLLPDGLAAFKHFHAANAYGPFATEALNVSFKRAAKRAGLDPASVHLYDLRHSFGTEVYRVTRDLETVGRLLLHAEGSPITARYARGANQDVDVVALKLVDAALSKARRASLKAAPALSSRSSTTKPKLVRRKSA